MKSCADHFRTVATLALLAAYAVSFAACGGDSSDAPLGGETLGSDGSVAGDDASTHDGAGRDATSIDGAKDSATAGDTALGSDTSSSGDTAIEETLTDGGTTDSNVGTSTDSSGDSADSKVGDAADIDSADSNVGDAANVDATEGGGDSADSGTCTAATTRCGVTGNVEQCTAGAWIETTTCPFGCAAGACAIAVSCTAGASQCHGKSVEICNSSGTAYLYSSTCATCAAGLCTGVCTPSAKRCNGVKVETCNLAGTTWDLTDTCTTFCDAGTSKCALPSLTVDAATVGSFDGEIVVAGAVIVKSGGTMTSAIGNLTIRAQSITVEAGGSIVVVPAGTGAAGTVGTTGCSMAPGGGGAGLYVGPANDSTVSSGNMGGAGGICNCCTGNVGGIGGKGGGVLRLVADTINIAGQVTANGSIGGTGTAGSGAAGGGGGGSGGGILLASNSLTVSGGISASGGGGGPGAGGTATAGTAGGLGRVKLLYGSNSAITGTISGQRTQASLPPLTITSTTHPDPNLIYNDDFPFVAITWNKPFPSLSGYYDRLDTAASGAPTPANGTFNASELVSFARASLVAGNNYFHIVPIDALSNVGTVESTFKVQINTAPPTVSSSSHPSSTTWSQNSNVLFTWTVPSGDANYAGFFYVLDHYGTTAPKTSDTILPITQKSLLRSGLADGVWAFHVVSVDQQGYLTKNSGHYRARIGADPGHGAILGKVVDAGLANVSGAKVTINRGLFNFAAEALDQTTSGTGDYAFPSTVPVGTWEVTVSKGVSSVTQMVTVTNNVSTTLNLTLP